MDFFIEKEAAAASPRTRDANAALVLNADAGDAPGREKIAADLPRQSDFEMRRLVFWDFRAPQNS